jgi:hypothetical protein
LIPAIIVSKFFCSLALPLQLSSLPPLLLCGLATFHLAFIEVRA